MEQHKQLLESPKLITSFYRKSIFINTIVKTMSILNPLSDLSQNKGQVDSKKLS